MPKPRYPNQRTVIIDNKIEKGQIFMMLVKNDLADACKDLNGSGFKVYCYLLSNQDGYKWCVSPAHAQKEWGIKTRTFKDGFNELIDKGYIKDGYIHQRKIIEKDEIRPIEEMDDNRQDDTDIVLWEDEYCMSNNNNNINNNNINKDILNTSVENIPQHPEEEEIICGYINASYLDMIETTIDDYHWKEHLNKGIWTSPTGKKYKVHYDIFAKNEN